MAKKSVVERLLGDEPLAGVVEPTVEAIPAQEPKKHDKNEFVSLPRREFAKMFYDLVQNAPNTWTGSAGRSRIARMLGATTEQEVQEIWKQYREYHTEKK